MSMTAVLAPGFENGEGIRQTRQRIEWVKVTLAAGDTTATNVAYTFAQIKSCAGIIGNGPLEATIDNANKQVTFAPIATAQRSSTFYIGLVEG